MNALKCVENNPLYNRGNKENQGTDKKTVIQIVRPF